MVAKVNPLLQRRGLPCKQEGTKTKYTDRQVPSPNRDKVAGSGQSAKKRKNKKKKLHTTTLSQNSAESETCNVYTEKNIYKKLHIYKRNKKLKDNVKNSTVLQSNNVTKIPLMMCRSNSYTGDGKMSQIIEALSPASMA